VVNSISGLAKGEGRRERRRREGGEGRREKGEGAKREERRRRERKKTHCNVYSRNDCSTVPTAFQK
jgi:hypothetical protein